jgi:hypothetical protein
MKVTKDLTKDQINSYLDILYIGILFWKDVWDRNLINKEVSYYWEYVKDHPSLFDDSKFNEDCLLYKNMKWCKIFMLKIKFGLDCSNPHSKIRLFYIHRVYKFFVKVYLSYKKQYNIEKE